MKVLRVSLFFYLTFSFCSCLFAQFDFVKDIGEEEAGIFWLNQVAPGSMQIYQGKNEGYWYLSGTAMNLAGYLIQGQNYIAGQNSSVNVPIGNLLGATGMSLYAYSQYALFVYLMAFWK